MHPRETALSLHAPAWGDYTRQGAVTQQPLRSSGSYSRLLLPGADIIQAFMGRESRKFGWLLKSSLLMMVDNKQNTRQYGSKLKVYIVHIKNGSL